MATFISLIRYTAQGIQHVSDTTKRSQAIKASGKKFGAKIKDVYWTLGAFDGAIVFDAADDETATAFMLHISSLGNVQTQTARAFDAKEMDGILAKLSK